MPKLSRATLLALIVGPACIETIAPPEPLPQVQVPFGPKIFLADQTFSGKSDHCKLIGPVAIADTATTVGGQLIEDNTHAYNCYVKVTPGAVSVDVAEVTNDLFQLCVDSEICAKPDPHEVSDADKLKQCKDEDSYGRCPVVGVGIDEARRVCEFMGKRLPTGVESIVLREPNQPQTPDAVQVYPTGDDAPMSPCIDAVLEDCKKPQPINIDASGGVTGGASLDKTAQGVYDLMGNVSEWSGDLMPIQRGMATNYPWWCVAPLPADAPIDANGARECPVGEVCGFGFYRHPDDTVVREQALCIVRADLSYPNGAIGTVFGGHYKTAVPAVASKVGSFARELKGDPADGTVLGEVGVRCVDAPGVTSGMTAVR